MEILKKGFGFLAGYKIHLMAIIQNVGQFYDLYGGRDNCDVFFQNMDYKIAYRQNERTDQEFVSNQLGMRTVKVKSKSSNGNVLSNKPSNITESMMARPLLSPEEVRTFPAEKGIAIINGHSPITYKRVVHYQDKRFKERVLPAVNVPVVECCYAEFSKDFIRAKDNVQPTMNYLMKTIMNEASIEGL